MKISESGLKKPSTVNSTKTELWDTTGLSWAKSAHEDESKEIDLKVLTDYHSKNKQGGRKLEIPGSWKGHVSWICSPCNLSKRSKTSWVIRESRQKSLAWNKNITGCEWTIASLPSVEEWSSETTLRLICLVRSNKRN